MLDPRDIPDCVIYAPESVVGNIEAFLKSFEANEQEAAYVKQYKKVHDNLERIVTFEVHRHMHGGVPEPFEEESLD